MNEFGLVAIFKSILIGVSLSAIPGPVFFETIRTTLVKNFISGVLVSVGQFIANFIILIVILFGISTFLTYDISKILLYLIGGTVLLYLSWSAWSLNIKHIQGVYRQTKGGNSIVTGFGISMTNPVLITLWISLFGSYLTQFNSKPIAFINIFSIMTGFVIFNICLALVIAYTRQRIPPKYIIYISRALGIFLLFYGGSFLVKFIQLVI